jgi:hypothetical protein
MDKWGILPGALERLLGLAGARWLLGVHIFRNRGILLDFADKHVVDSA